METTQNGIKLPISQEIFNVDPYNDNAKILDEHLSDTDIHVNASQIDEAAEPDKLIQINSDDTNSTLWGKIKKSISVLINHIDKVASKDALGHIKIGSGLQMQDGTANVKIANNLTTNDSTIALSAAMGAQLNKSLESKQNASTAINTSNIGNQNVTSAFIVRDNKSAHTFSFSWVDDSKFEIYVDGILVRTLIGFREEI